MDLNIIQIIVNGFISATKSANTKQYQLQNTHLCHKMDEASTLLQSITININVSELQRNAKVLQPQKSLLKFFFPKTSNYRVIQIAYRFERKYEYNISCVVSENIGPELKIR